MVLDFEYSVNTGNRFHQFVDHDEEAEDFIAVQTKEEEQKQKKSVVKDSKQSTKKVTTTKTTAPTTTAKTNKENLNTKTANIDQRRQQSATTTTASVFTDSNNQQTRADSARGARGGARRGGPSQEGGAARGGRSQRFNKFEGKGPSTTNESTSFDQGGEPWSTETGGRGGRGRGSGPRRGNFEGSRGTGNRGRGRGGRGNFTNRNEDGSQQENNGWQQSAESNFESTRQQSDRDYDQEVSPTERPFEPDNIRRTGRGNYRGRSYRSHGDSEGGQDDYRANRRQYDRQPRSFVSSVKAIEKKDGEGAHNWGNPTENPEDHPISDEITETTVPSTTPATKDWSQQVDEAEKQMTLDEYKKKIEEKKRAHQEKLPQFNTRAAGEGEDPKNWQKFEQEYRKKNDPEDEGEEEEEEEGSDDEENESIEEIEEEQVSGKKKLITIPLRFKPIELQRGSANSRFGQRRGGNRYRGNRDEQQRSTSPNQGQQSPSDDQANSYRSGPRGGGGGGGRGDQRRSNRGSRQGRSNADPNAPALDNPEDFPTLPKQ